MCVGGCWGGEWKENPKGTKIFWSIFLNASVGQTDNQFSWMLTRSQKPDECCVQSSSGPSTVGAPRPRAEGHDPQVSDREPFFGRACLRRPVPRTPGKPRAIKTHHRSPPRCSTNKAGRSRELLSSTYSAQSLLLSLPRSTDTGGPGSASPGLACDQTRLKAPRRRGQHLTQSVLCLSSLRSSFCAAVHLCFP